MRSVYKYSAELIMKPATLPVLRATRLLDQVRERSRYKHYSLRKGLDHATPVHHQMTALWVLAERQLRVDQGPSQSAMSRRRTERRVVAQRHRQVA